jgi:hypothetical protein
MEHGGTKLTRQDKKTVPFWNCLTARSDAVPAWATLAARFPLAVRSFH